MKVSLALLESGYVTISFFEQELEHICKVKGGHTKSSDDPCLKNLLEEILFGAKFFAL